MEPFVTQEQCEQRRKEIIDDNAKQTENISKLYGETKALSVKIDTALAQNKWFMTIISTVLGGLLLWLITT